MNKTHIFGMGEELPRGVVCGSGGRGGTKRRQGLITGNKSGSKDTLVTKHQL